MADVVDIAPDGSRQLLSSGALKAQFRALDPQKSTDWRPVHPRQEPVPVQPGKVERYDIALTPTANLFQKGHRMELVIRNQDDMLGKLSRSGVYLMPFMRTVTHTIHLGQSICWCRSPGSRQSTEQLPGKPGTQRALCVSSLFFQIDEPGAPLGTPGLISSVLLRLLAYSFTGTRQISLA